MKLALKKPTQFFFKTKYLNIHFTKDAGVTNKYMKRCSTLAAVGNKAVRYYHTPLEWQKLKSLILPNVGEDMEELDLSYTAGGDAK